jgi:hypothetical protein
MIGADSKWVRPVSDRQGKELSIEERHYEGRIEPSLLDVIDIIFLRSDPHDYQSENQLIDPNYYWSNAGHGTYVEAERLLDPLESDLWGLSPDNSYHGQYDRIASAEASSFGRSLRLIAVDDLAIRVRAEGATFGNMKKKLRGYFTYSGNGYALTVTDPTIEGEFLSRSEDTYPVGPALLCVSLSEPFDGYIYKLIAGVILPP